MSLITIYNGRARFDSSANVATDRYSAGIRYTQEGATRATTSAGTFFNQGIPMDATGRVSIVDASTGLPSGTIYHNGLPISGEKVCISNKAVAVVSNGIPFDAAGAVAAAVAPITDGPTLDLWFVEPVYDDDDVSLDLNFVDGTYCVACRYTVWE